MHNTLHIPTVKNIFTVRDNKSFKVVQVVDKSFKAFVVPKTLPSTILVNSHNLQRCAGRNKMYSLNQKRLFGRECAKDIY